MVNMSEADKPFEKCGIVGIYGVKDASRDVYFGLYSIQHRGQESAGISASDGQNLKIHKGPGLISQVFCEEDIDSLEGEIAIGHNRYSTSKGTLNHSQPVSINSYLTLGHNGNLPTTEKLEEFLADKAISPNNLNDSEQMYQAISYFLKKGASLPESVEGVYPLLQGAFAVVAQTKDQMVAFQDPFAIKPLSLGRFRDGWVVASETCAFDTIGATFLREVEPGEMIVFDKGEMKPHQLKQGSLKRDIFEFVYFSRPDSIMMGKNVYEVRKNSGKILARECPLDVDIVIPIPDSAIPAAIGYAEELGLHYEEAIIKNRYIFRTFINPDPGLRRRGVKLKLNVVPHLVSGRRVVVIDDSIVRGTTSPQQIKMLRRAGAKEVNFLVSSPPYKYPHLYGIDTRVGSELIAGTLEVDEICEAIGADHLCYLSFDGLIKATELPEDVFTTSCFSGIYPTPI